MRTQSNHKRILVIDDEVSILDTIQIVLEIEGHEVILKENPPSTSEIVKLNPDLIFLDLLLKGTTGKAVCLNLKGNPQTRNIPIIMISAHTKPILKEAAQICGAQAYLPKPFDVEDLFKMVKRYAH